ncbi:MAG: hypothetical protein DDT31_00511 [Syntrophomonadaceae bacterium]|nr:hypothetical protein [Bacillota bacterium]
MTFVDLSKAGLHGQQAFADRMLALAQAESAEATAAFNQVSADTKELELERMMRLDNIDRDAAASLAAISSGKPDPSRKLKLSDDSAAIPLEHYARAYMNSGLFEHGKEAYIAASEIRKRESEVESAQVQDKERRLGNIQKRASIVGQILSSVRTEKDFRRALDKFQHMADSGSPVIEPEHLEQLRNSPIDGDTIAYYVQAARDVESKTTHELSWATETRQAITDAANISLSAERNRISWAELDHRKLHDLAMQKHAGAVATTATTVTDNARDAMAAKLVSGPLRDFIDPDTKVRIKRDSPLVAALAHKLEEDAQILVKTRPITMDQARHRVIELAIASGEIELPVPDEAYGAVKRLFGKGLKPDPGKITRSPSRDAPRKVTPLEFPEPPKDKKDLVIGEKYNLLGHIVVWDGQNLIYE